MPRKRDVDVYYLALMHDCLKFMLKIMAVYLYAKIPLIRIEYIAKLQPAASNHLTSCLTVRINKCFSLS